jgi:peptidoglycan/xylan/chitin deacetylase (PgdA/CDA1 family)
MTVPSHQRASPWPLYQWPDGKRSAFCFTVDVDEQSPLLWGLRNEGPSRLLGHAEQRAYGSRVGIWRLLDLLEEFQIKASFFVPAVVAERHPELLPAFVARDHEIGLHGYFHEIVSHISDAEFSEALQASIDLFRQQTGRTPAGFRSPAWEMTPHMLSEVRRLGMYDSSLAGFDHPYSLGGVVEVPVQWALDDAVYFKFLGGGSDHWPPASTHQVLEMWLDEWEGLHQDGGLFMLTIHDWISGRAHRVTMLRRLLQRVCQDSSCWVATVGEVARHHAQSVNLEAFEVPVQNPQAIGPRRFGQEAR